MTDDYISKTARSANTFLKRWQGADVLVRELRVSHRTLEIVLFRSRDEMATRNLVLGLYPLWFEGSFEWSDCGMTVSVAEGGAVPSPGGSTRDRVFELRDDGSAFRCFTEYLSVAEHSRLRPH